MMSIFPRENLDFIKSRAQKSKSATDWDAYRTARNTFNNLAKKNLEGLV